MSAADAEAIQLARKTVRDGMPGRLVLQHGARIVTRETSPGGQRSAVVHVAVVVEVTVPLADEPEVEQYPPQMTRRQVREMQTALDLAREARR